MTGAGRDERLDSGGATTCRIGTKGQLLAERIPREAATHQRKLGAQTLSGVWKLKVRYLGAGRTGSFWRL